MDQVEEIKNKMDIVELIQEYLPLKKAGRNYKANCPFHGEKTPSFMVNPELQIFKCFGCGAGGDVYEFLKRMEGMEFGEALQHLAKRTGITLVTYKPTAFEEQKDKLLAINSKAADYYHYLLTKHKLGEPARKYLADRRITDEAIERYKLGFSPDGWDFAAKYLVDKKGFKSEELERAGLVIKKSPENYYDRFRNRIMFPLNNTRGQTVGFAGRVMPGADEKSGGKYVNTPETEIYHKGELLYGLDVNRSEIKTKGWAVVVEGEVDSIASWQAGVKNVVAIKGSALTEKQVELLRRLCETVVLGLDADSAGDAASRRGIAIAQKQGLIIKVINAEAEEINPKGYKDPGDWAANDKLSWQAAVAGAVPIYDFYLESAVRRFGLDAIGKEKIGRELLPVWGGIDDEIVKAHYIKKLANVLGVEDRDIRAQMLKHPDFTNTSLAKQPTSVISKQPNSRREILEEYLMGLALRNNWVGKLKKEKVKLLIKTPFWVKVATELEEEGKKGVDKLPFELKEKTENLFLEEEEGDPEKEWTKVLGMLEEMDIRERIDEIRSDMDDKNKQKEMIRLTARLAELTRSV